MSHLFYMTIITLWAALPCAAQSPEHIQHILPKSAPVKITVPATACPWLAACKDGTTTKSNDVAPDQSPVVVDSIAIIPGDWLEFAASGTVDHCPKEVPCNPAGPDGSEGAEQKLDGAENGIGDAVIPLSALVGVFIEKEGTPAPLPPKADFSTPQSRTASTVRPRLRQPFYIGTGKDGTGRPKRFLVPENAGSLVLGVMDGSKWHDNAGEFTVLMTPCVGISAHPKSIELAPGATAMFAVTGTGSGPLLYRWFRRTADKDKPVADGPTPSGSVVSGCDTPVLSIVNTGNTDVSTPGDGYYCQVSASCGMVKSRAATLVFDTPQKSKSR